MIKKSVYLLLLLLAVDILVACCNCASAQLFKYTNTELALQPLDNRGQLPVAVTDDTALKEAFGIRLTVKCETIALQPNNFSFLISRSYAFSCRCPEPIQYHPKDSIIALRIIAMDDFDATHPAGTDVTTLFQLFKNNFFITVEKYLQQEPEIFYMDNDKQIVLDALLMQAPAASVTCRFRVEVDLSDGRKLIKETSPVRLL